MDPRTGPQARRRRAPRTARTTSTPARIPWPVALPLVLVLACQGLAGCERGTSAAPAAPPNVLLVSIDSLRADRVHALGNKHETSPTIDALAQDGVLFRNAVSASSWTIPAHMTLLTGMFAREHGVIVPQRRLRPEVVTLAEALRDAGYATAGFVSGPTVRAVYGFAQGFDSFDDDTVVAPSRLLSQKGISSPKLAELATAWLDRWQDGGARKPFFLFVHMWDVHYDYEPPPPYDTLFDPDYTGDVTGDQFEMNPAIHAGMPERDLEHLRALYDGEIRFTDEHLGRIVARLRAMGVLDDTIVVVTSDHGDEFFEHGSKGHGHTLFEEVVHIPLVVRYPRRIAGGQTVDRQVRLADVAPTILGLAGVTPPAGFGSRIRIDGISSLDLSPWLGDAARSADLPHLVGMLALRKQWTAVRTDDHKLIFRTRGREQRSLFDLRSDPGEQSDLVATGDGRETEARLLGQYLAFHRATATLPPAFETWDPDAELTERLRALGYVTDGPAKRQQKREQRRAEKARREANPPAGD